MNNGRDTLRDKYPEGLIKSGLPGKYAKRYQEGTNLVVIDPDSREIFPDSESVNRLYVIISPRGGRHPNHALDRTAETVRCLSAASSASAGQGRRYV